MTMLKLPGLRKSLLTESIVWIQAENNYAWVHIAGNQCYLATQTLKWFERQLSQFIRIHKSALVNPTHIVAFNRTTSRMAQIVLSSGVKLQVSRRQMRMVVDRLECIVSEADLLREVQ